MFMMGVLCTVCGAQVYLKLGNEMQQLLLRVNLWEPLHISQDLHMINCNAF